MSGPSSGWPASACIVDPLSQGWTERSFPQLTVRRRAPAPLRSVFRAARTGLAPVSVGSMRQDHLRLGAFFYATGHHVAGWRHPSSEADGGLDPRTLRRLGAAGRGGEVRPGLPRGRLRHPGPNLRSSERTARSTHFEPVTLLSALAAVTSRIGLVATTSTSFNEPYNVARRFASLDHLSGGRAGWNLVTSATDAEAANFGGDRIARHGDRYERAEEFVDVVLGLWNTWDDDAVDHRPRQRTVLEARRLPPARPRGKHFEVRGPLNISRTPQGQPVLVQAGLLGARQGSGGAHRRDRLHREPDARGGGSVLRRPQGADATLRPCA